MKTTALPVVAAILACLLAAAPASAAPVDDAVAATTMTPAAPPAGVLGVPVGPIGQALDHLVKEAPERVKTLQDNFRKNADALRERVRGGLTRVIGTGTTTGTGVEATTKARPRSTAPSTSTTTTTAAPPAGPTANKPPTALDTAAPTTPGNVPDTTTQKQESRTLIGAPKRCGPNMKADRNGRCREVYQDTDDES